MSNIVISDVFCKDSAAAEGNFDARTEDQGAHEGANFDAFVEKGYMAMLLPAGHPLWKVSPHSAVKDPQKVPMVMGEHGAVGMTGWTSRPAATRKDIDLWKTFGAAEGQPANVCVRLGQIDDVPCALGAMDCDISDTVLAAKVKDAWIAQGGEAPARTRPDSAKFTLLFRRGPDIATVGKARMPFRGTEAVEILGQGNQTVVAGLRKVGVPIEWRDGIPAVDELPVLDGAAVSRFLAAVEDLQEAEGFPRGGSRGGEGSSRGRLGSEYFLAPNGNDDLRQWLHDVPNTAGNFPSSDDVLKAVIALKASSPDPDDLMPDVVEWLESFDGSTDQAKEPVDVWDSVKDAGVGYPYLCEVREDFAARDRGEDLAKRRADRKKPDGQLWLEERGRAVGIDPGDPGSPGYAARAATIQRLMWNESELPEEHQGEVVQDDPIARYRYEDGSIKWPDTKPVKRGGKVVFKPQATCLNTQIAIQHLGVECSYDVFHDRRLVGGHPIVQWAGELSDDAVLMLRDIIRKRYEFDPGTQHAFDAARQLCAVNKFDPVLEYLDGLRWDGKERLDRWLMTYLGAKDTELNRWFGRLFLIAAVRRVRKPGTKFDQILVLESPEGFNKSTAIRVLAGDDNFSDQTILGKSDKEQMELIQGRWLYEIAELSGIGKAEVEAVKAFASRNVDRARPAYGRCVVDRPRRCVFLASTNDRQYLKSPTGNRRMWPCPVGVCGPIDLEALTRDRDQIWAEAAALEADGVSIVLPEHLWKVAGEIQESRREVHPWEDVLAGVQGEVKGSSVFVTSAALFTKLEIPVERQNGAQGKLMGQIMRQLGWEGPERFYDADGIRVRGFRRAAAPEDAAAAVANW